MKKLFYNLLAQPAASHIRHSAPSLILLWALSVFPFLLFAQAPPIQWEHSFGGSGSDRANAVVRLNDGGYIVAGYSASTDGDITGNHGRDDYWIVKIDAGGAKQWEKSFGGGANDEASAIQQTNDGGYIVAGQSLSTDGDV
ncbi:MAG TPA: hypothetical protein VFJ29_02505, partial [Candidatus Kapabacteria bacterium]|nr:hypothetical protein [Candidatus Kapabacteria bacterium]